jgi:hypothetical protein
MGPKLYISTTQVSEHNRLVVCFETESVHYAFGSMQDLWEKHSIVA